MREQSLNDRGINQTGSRVLNITKKWKSPPANWKSAANQFAVQFGPRFCQAASSTTQAP